MKIDTNATGFINIVLGRGNCVYFNNLTMDELGQCFVMWRNKVTVKDMASDKSKIPDHNKSDKLKYIAFSEKNVLENNFTDTTLIGMRKNEASPIVIGDGIHRAIGIYKAYLSDNSIQDKLNLRLLLFEGESISKLDDYVLSIIEE